MSERQHPSPRVGVRAFTRRPAIAGGVTALALAYAGIAAALPQASLIIPVARVVDARPIVAAILTDPAGLSGPALATEGR